MQTQTHTAHPKIPEPHILLFKSCCLCNHLPLTHELINKIVSVFWREHVVCFFSRFTCECVFPGDPVKGKAALLYRRVRGPRQASPSRSSFLPPLYVLPPPSLQPCAQTDTHKMFQEGRMSCMVPTCIHSLWHELPMQHCTRQTRSKHGWCLLYNKPLDCTPYLLSFHTHNLCHRAAGHMLSPLWQT